MQELGLASLWDALSSQMFEEKEQEMQKVAMDMGGRSQVVEQGDAWRT
jgi:hypothetical protein